MNGFTNFLAVNYIWFIIITLILIFALVGYLVDAKEIKTGKVKKSKDSELKIIDFSTVDQSKSLGDSVKDNEANNLNLDNYTSDQTTAEETAQEEVVQPVEEQNIETKTDTAVAEDTDNPMYGSTTEYQQAESLEKKEAGVVETAPTVDQPIATAISEDDSSNIKVV